jgi:glutamyl-tRNA reductase
LARELIIVGVNHRTAPVEVREQLAPANGSIDALLADLVQLPEIHEAVVVSTCNRVEVVTCWGPGGDPVATVARSLFQRSGLEADHYRQCLFELRDREAVRHVFRVASSLDSMVVGEPQILGQLKEHFERSAAARAAGPILRRVFHKSFSVAKRVRSETGVASRAVSVASAAVDLAGKIFESLADRTVMLMGTGEIGEAAARHFIGTGVARVMVANRTFETAVDLARDLGGTPVPFDRVATYLPLADLVVGSAGGGELLDAQEVRRVLRERNNKPMFFIDLAVPRNFDAAINDVDNAYLFDIDDLGAVVEENRGERQREAVRGEAIVEQEVDRFWQWFEKLDVAPTIAELRARAEDIRQREVSRTLERLNALSDADRDRIDSMTRAIVNKLLHGPTSTLKGDRSGGDELELLSAVRELFGLGEKQ